MHLFCIEDFKIEYDKLKTKKSYNTIEEDIIDYFFGKSIQELASGARLNNSAETPYIKKRLNGRGGFRFYFLLLIKQENLYLMFVHPKTGSLGYENISDESKALLYKKVLESIKSKNIYSVSRHPQEKKLIFTKV